MFSDQNEQWGDQHRKMSAPCVHPLNRCHQRDLGMYQGGNRKLNKPAAGIEDQVRQGSGEIFA